MLCVYYYFNITSAEGIFLLCLHVIIMVITYHTHIDVQMHFEIKIGN